MVEKDETVIDPKKLTRTGKKEAVAETTEEKDKPVSSPVGMAIDLAFNPTRDKIREVTVIDRMQGRLFPQLDMINYMRGYVLEIAYYREDAENYKRLYNREMPKPPEPLDEFMFRTAQWQKSVEGTNLNKITDIALAETEVSADKDEPTSIRVDDAFKD